MYEDRHMWAEAYLHEKFFGGMRSKQRSEGMNAYLNHYVNRSLRLIEFVKQMDRLIDRQIEGEGKDDFDSYDGQPILTTHLKLYEQQAAKKYTRAMFRLVRDEIDKEGMLTVVLCDRDIMSTTYKVRRFGVSAKELKVVINQPTKTFDCSCKLMETIGIPYSHSFVVMKAENVTEILSSMIVARWTKEAKMLHRTSPDTSLSNLHYMTEEARVGLIYASCRSLLRYAASSMDACNLAITNIHNLTMKLESMCQKEGPEGQPSQKRDTAVQDPEVVLTKRSVKKSKDGATATTKMQQMWSSRT